MACNANEAAALILTKDGKVLSICEYSKKSRPIDSFVGIAIQYVVSAPNGGLICMLTDRGILITKGSLCPQSDKSLFT